MAIFGEYEKSCARPFHCVKALLFLNIDENIQTATIQKSSDFFMS